MDESVCLGGKEWDGIGGNPTQSPDVPIFPKIFPTVTLVQAANNDMKLYLTIEDSVKVANLAQPLESSMLKVVPAPSQPCPSNNRFRNPVEFITRPKCNHTQAKPKLVLRPKQSALMDDKYNELGKISPAKSGS
ncbi:hypothetical protein ACTXT7_001807 [Hymenolepis weldensis]